MDLATVIGMIAGFGLAADIAGGSMDADFEHLSALNERLWSGLSQVAGVARNGAAEHAFPGILNVSVEDIEGESLLLALEPLCVATGSACNAKNAEPSYVLRALGRSDAEAQSAIRFSLGRHTTESDVDCAIQIYRNAVSKLRCIAPGEAA